jgi:hypothetical protein
MKKEEKLKIQLSHQSSLIIDLIVSLEYLINFSNYLETTENDKPKDLWFIYRVIRDNVILILNKLFNGNEDYSFAKLNSVLIELRDKKDPKMIEYFNNLKLGNKLFTKLEINEIRNSHVGHLDSNRTKKNIDWIKVRELKDIACTSHNQISLMVFNSQNYWELDKYILNRFYKKDLIYLNLIRTWREKKKNREESISINEIDKLIKINWP